MHLVSEAVMFERLPRGGFMQVRGCGSVAEVPQ